MGAWTRVACHHCLQQDNMTTITTLEGNCTKTLISPITHIFASGHGISAVLCSKYPVVRCLAPSPWHINKFLQLFATLWTALTSLTSLLIHGVLHSDVQLTLFLQLLYLYCTVHSRAIIISISNGKFLQHNLWERWKWHKWQKTAQSAYVYLSTMV
jgi:hypothetical protein